MSEESLHKIIGKNIKKYRNLNNEKLTQKELAKKFMYVLL